MNFVAWFLFAFLALCSAAWLISAIAYAMEWHRKRPVVREIRTNQGRKLEPADDWFEDRAA